jgi:hypothetical protein
MKAVEDDVLGELNVVLQGTLARDDQHGRRTFTREFTVAANKGSIIYGSTPTGGDVFVDQEVFHGKARQDLPNK